MIILILELELVLPMMLALALLAVGYIRFKHPKPEPVGEIFKKLNAVNSDEIREHRREMERESELNPHLKRVQRKKEIRIHFAYLRQMESNTLCFEQVARFEETLIPAGKSSFDYKERQALAVSLIGECAQLRMELLQARLDLTRRKLFSLSLDQDRLHNLLVRYKSLEHDLIELADYAKDKTWRDMLMERLGLKNWRIIDGGRSEPGPA